MDQTQITPDKLNQIRAEHEGWLKNLGTSPGQVKDSYQIVELVDEILRLRGALEPIAKPAVQCFGCCGDGSCGGTSDTGQS